MTVVAPQESSKAHRRHRALEAALEQLRAHCAATVGSPAADPPGSIPGRTYNVDVDPWALAQIQATYECGGDPCSGDAELLAHGIAFLVKCAEDRGRLEGARRNPGERRALFAAQAELMLDMAVGMALVREMQQEVQAAVQSGRMDRARNLTRFQHDLRSTVSDVKTLLAEAECRRAEVLSDNLTDQPRADEPVVVPRREPRPSLADQRRTIQQRARMRKRARQALARLPSRTELLFALLTVLVCLWLGVVKSQRFFEVELPVMSLADFQNGEGLKTVESHFPSLYITLDTSVWQRFEPTRRHQLIESVSSIAAAKGFGGVLFRTADGRPVARWLTKRGTELIVRDEPGAVRTPPVVEPEPPEPDPFFVPSAQSIE